MHATNPLGLPTLLDRPGFIGQARLVGGWRGTGTTWFRMVESSELTALGTTIRNSLIKWGQYTIAINL